MKNKKALSFCTAVFSIMLLSLSLFSVYKTGAVEDLNPAADKVEAEVKIEANFKNTVEGVFIDRDGEAITEYSEPGKAAVCLYPESFSSIIGYNSVTKAQSGLRKTLYTDLFDGGDDDVGATVQLTINANLQNRLYRLLEGIGSISIVNGSTGEVVAMASRRHPEIDYNVNKIDEFYTDADGSQKTYYDLYQSLDKFLLNSATTHDGSTGSCAKMMTTVALCDTGMEEFTIEDNGKALGFITNQHNAVYGHCDLPKALRHSVNTYFAKVGEALGYRLKKTFNQFSVGIPIETDFGIIRSNFSNGEEDAKLYASNAYGQGELEISPLHMASIAATIMNKGVQYKPYMIQSMSNDGEVIYNGMPEILNTVANEEAMEKAKDYLHKNAFQYDFYRHYSEDEVYIIAKTGTAEVASSVKNHIYFTFGIEFGGECYGVCIDRAEADQSSSSLKRTAKEVIDILMSEMPVPETEAHDDE